MNEATRVCIFVSCVLRMYYNKLYVYVCIRVCTRIYMHMFTYMLTMQDLRTIESKKCA